MWDFSFELPALLLIGIILGAYYSTKHLPTRLNGFYLQMITICIVTGIANILSGWLDSRYGSVWSGAGRLFLELLNMFFYMMLFARSMSLFFYYLIALKLFRTKTVRYLCAAIFIQAEIMIAVASATGEFHFFDAEGYHLTGSYHLFAYIQMILCGLMIFLLLRCRDRVKAEQRRCLILTLGIALAAALLDRFLPYMLISDMLMALILLALYLFFMNPSLYISSRTNTFNLEGLAVMLDSYDPAEYRVMGVTLKNYLTLREIFYSEAVSQSLVQIGSFLNSVAGISVFYIREGNFILFMKQDTDPDQTLAELKKRLNQAWICEQTEVFYDTGYVVVNTDKMPRDEDKFLVLMRGGMQKAEKDEVTVIDDRSLERAKRHETVHHILDRCIQNNAIQVYLQPLVHASDGSLVGAEALARLIDPEMGLISPGEFIPIAEDTGVITDLGRQMLQKTCGFLKDNKIPGLRWVNVNVSPAQFVNTKLSEEYGEMVRKSGIDPELIHLEITEAAYVTEDSLHQRMDAFIRQNFRIALDDFGSGYSNLNRVMDYPFSNIKLDMGFVRTGLAKKGNLLGDLIHAFHDMGFSVTAEGIETEEMADRMRAYGCDYFQGYLFSKPLPIKEFLAKYADREPR
ncbi:MAG: EAL domain-containing protein [Eubacterium sp.]|nr:EAL domain-containing protein [Eubacterium sp.]